MVLTWLALGSPSVAATEEDRWKATLDRVTKGVVSIRMDRPRAYEGKGAANSTATGFVVNAEQGLILTNRHVVTPGPNVAKAIFLNQEEVDLVPVYRDPVHDFGVFRYDPDDVRFLDVPELRLRPDKAKVGTAIRVVGNDAGEKISILDSTLARLDRNAPKYGSDYNDFNTFYLQAATSTSGGSSGSPVMDRRGDVLALNAGGKTRAASSFYLPLDRVVRAVGLLERGEAVSRGTLQVRWAYEPYDELVRLGLSEEREVAARRADPDGSGLLVLRELLPGGPADGHLQIGDILLSADGTDVFDFVTLEGILDDHVGQTIELRVDRSGEPVDVSLQVDDLHALVPSRYLELSGAVLHDLSLHQARVMQVPVRGVHVASNGYGLERDGLPTKAILVQADEVPLPDLQALIDHLATVPEGDTVTFRWYAQGSPQLQRQTTVRIDRTWFSTQVCTRDDATGTWPCTSLTGPPASEPDPAPAATFPPVDDKRGAKLVSSLVRVECDVPYQVAGLPGDSFTGGGLIVDAERGWVLVDRDTVPLALAEVTVTVAGAVRVPAEVVALHPLHNTAIVAYDPQRLADLGLRAAELSFDALAEGDELWSVELERDATLEVREMVVRGVDPLWLGTAGAPRFRDTNIEAAQTDPAPSNNGVLVDKKGRVLGFHASFSYTQGGNTRATWRTIPSQLIRETVQLARGTLQIRAIGWELGMLTLPDALQAGLPSEWAERLIAHDPDRRSVLSVGRLVRGTGADGVVATGDLVLAIQGRPATRFRDIDEAVAGESSVAVTVARQGEVMELTVPTEVLGPVGVDRVVLWAGVRIHAPHRAAHAAGMATDHPYVSWWMRGSPAARASLGARRAILKVGNTETPDLDAFVAAIRQLDPEAPVRLEVTTLQGERQVLTLQPDPVFWPAEELVWEGGSWTRRGL
ncbi:MAG: trypsin-like peptidase domain-containing protein [Myxococcales bacterium]|nr:trypsin-like peptidase domain-containing protein [Myxococcales bacterium]